MKSERGRFFANERHLSRQVLPNRGVFTRPPIHPLKRNFLNNEGNEEGLKTSTGARASDNSNLKKVNKNFQRLMRRARHPTITVHLSRGNTCRTFFNIIPIRGGTRPSSRSTYNRRPRPTPTNRHTTSTLANPSTEHSRDDQATQAVGPGQGVTTTDREDEGTTSGQRVPPGLRTHDDS